MYMALLVCVLCQPASAFIKPFLHQLDLLSILVYIAYIVGFVAAYCSTII